MKTLKILCILLSGIIILESCATIISGKTQKVNITSEPSGAKIFINGKNTGTVTPSEIKVKRKVKDSPNSIKKTQTYVLKKEGFQDYSYNAKSKYNFLPSVGNFFTFFAGFIIDGANGASRVYPKEHHFTLNKGGSNNLIIERTKKKKHVTEEVPQIVKIKKSSPNQKNTTNTIAAKKIVKSKVTNTKTLSKPVIILDEDFSDNTFKWKEKSEKKASYQIKDGMYTMKDNTFKLKSPKQYIPNFNSKSDNYILEASFSFLDTKKYKLVGLGFGFSPDSAIHYVFNIIIEEGVKKIAITPFLGVGLKTMNQKPIFKGEVKEINLKENIIRIEKENDRTKFYINDKLLVESPGVVFNSSLIKFNTGIWNLTGVNWIKITKTGVTETVIRDANKRDIAFQKIRKNDILESHIETTESVNFQKHIKGKIKKADENDIAKNVKYRRSSLYTLMVYDPIIKFNKTIKNTFGNLDVPQKFNDHNVGPYSILSISNIKQQESQINSFLTRNNIAKKMVAKWFNRDLEGKFNMNLIAERGLYDASAIDQAIASNMARGNAILADAGEELINKTFIVVNDFKFIDKAEKGKFLTDALNEAARQQAKDGEIGTSLVTGALSFGVSAGAKGYIIRSTSYLYQLEWNDEIQANFYHNYWTDKNNFDPAKVAAFNQTNDYKLKFIGSQSALADVQSSIFTDKTDEDLIKIATEKAIDKAIAKLERKFEAFRTKTPLVSTDPLAAKIGTKEGLEGGDKFEVLEMKQDPETGKTTYKRVGVIKVDGKNIWNNNYTPEEMKQLEKEGKLPKLQYTIFKGSGNYYPGQLIKQIN